ncbi:MAG: hypothetical protein J2P31_11400, partial [Blastocatellia bacterium]|nr:hypothetical protein [Blastocatellia bacterium]
QLPIGRAAWEDTAIVVNGEAKCCRYRNIITGELLTAKRRPDGTGEARLPLAEVFAHLPVALLERI